MGDQFNSATQQDLKAGGDGAKQYGWNLFNSIHAAIADANITYPNLLYIQATGASNPTGASFNVPFVYQKIKGDFDVNTAMVSGIPNHHNYGFICRDPNASAGEDWLGLCTYYDDQTYSYNTANSNSSATGLSAVRIYLRIKRAGNVFTTFTSTDGNTWTQHQQYTRTDLAITVQVGMYTPDASGALYDYFLGSYTITPITVKLRLYNRLSLANNYGNYLKSSATEQLPTYLSNPLAAGESAIYCRNAIAAALTALSVKGLSSEIINLFIAHPLTPEYLRHVRLDILEGWRRLLSLPNKIVDSGIETTIYAGSALSDTKRFDIQNTISEGYRTMLYSLTRIVDSGIEASLFIGSSLSSIIDAYTGNTISEGFNKSHYVRSEISDPVNMTLTLRNTLERALALSSYIKVAIDSGPGVKRQSIVWDIRLDGLSIKAAAKGITLTKDEAEAISHIEIELAGLEHYDQCDPAINHERQRIELEMGSVTYRFLLESREMSQIYGS
ncbi:MAG: hypothetical protein HQK97_12675, partial [Nitrospirae bacterium]|nr:hypothetical protein [Nitrospirota bacterium]